MTKLKRCPFCGGEAKLIINYDYDGKPRKYTATCIKEYCPGQSNKSYDSEKFAVLFWNQRTPEIVRCGECRRYKAANNKIGVCDLQIDMVSTDYFCSYGERREEDAKKK